MTVSIEEYKKRIVQLEKKNKDLKVQVEELIRKNEKNEKVLSDLSIGTGARESRISSASKTLRYKMVTVLFSDVKGFTKLTGQMDAEALIDELDKFFFKFDEVVKKFNIEKIKSIGDTYMAAGGIPKKNRTNPVEVILAAIEMREYLRDLQKEHAKHNIQVWDLTFGLHTGPVVAGVVGKKKISYEIKGDTVNIASRIESSSEVGKINISAMTYEFVKDYFICEYRGKMPIKYMGDIDMYTVKSFRPELSTDKKGLIPNKNFRTKFQLIRYDDLNEVVLDRLEQELPKYLFYHNLKHTIDVVIEVEIIGKGEGINEEELLLLKTAALFHDSGQIYGAKDHEDKSCEIAREILPKYDYDEEQINAICDIIMATKLPPEPKTKLENIICDSDLDYLGRSDFIPVSNTLFKELAEQNIITDENEWNKMQVKFISGHQYFTKTANNLREVNKQKQIDRIKSLIY
ncbi:MAG: HD domain-containing protein [Bacteroidales bacterium]|nr:HD domain-containing protein [Bacteroidales bacterium]